MMDIRNARRIATLVDNQEFKGFRVQIRAAFYRLHMSAERGHKEDRALAKILWDYAPLWLTADIA